MSRDQAAWDEISEQNDNFDYKKLYVTNIPLPLSEDGLKHVFSKFGKLSRCFLHRDKRYGLVEYDTPGEAKIAMLSTNQTPPLSLKVAFARKKPTSQETDVPKRRNNFVEDRIINMAPDKPVDRNENLENNDIESVTTTRSWGKRSVIVSNVETEISCNDNISDLDEVQLALELEKIELLKAQHRYKVALYNAEKKNQSAKPNIHITMWQDGKHVYKLSDDKARGPHDDPPDSQHNAPLMDGTGPGISKSSCSEPKLIPFATLQCVLCSDAATALCSRCRITPYCSQHCQRADWSARHSAVCHNLALNVQEVAPDQTKGDEKANLNPVAPLRKPHFVQSDSAKPAANANAGTSSPQVRQQNKRYDKQNQDGNRNSQDGRFKNDSNRTNQDNRYNKEPVRYNQKRQTGDQAWKFERKYKTDGDKKFNNRPKSNESRLNTPAEQKPSVKQDDIEENWEGSSKAQETEVVKAIKENETPTTDSLQATKKNDIEDIPAKSIVELVPVGETIMVSVEQPAAQCRAEGDYVCISLHENYETAYQALCEDYLAECEAICQKDYKPSAGELYSMFESSEGAWYRARHLGAAQPSALVDAARLASAADVNGAPRARLPSTSAHAQAPEFSCVLITRAAVQVGQQLICKIVSRNADGSCAVKIEAEGAALGEGVLKRWSPTVTTPKLDRTSISGSTAVNHSTQPLNSPKTPKSTPSAPAVAPSPAVTPSVQSPEPVRPQHSSGVEVVIVDVTSPDRLFLRAADAATQRAYDMCIEDVALFGQHAQPLTQPPSMGQLVIAKFSDDIHYRALVTRTNVKQNKYLLEYIEFGNIEKTCMERLYDCPSEYDLSHKPALASRAKLHGVTETLTPEAQKYLEDLKENGTPLIVTLPDGAKTAVSGSEVILTVAKNMVNINRKLQEMCKPQWKQTQEQGVDILKTKVTLLEEIKYVDLPANGGLLQILDMSMLQTKGILSACEVGDPNIPVVLGPLSDKMEAFCASDYGCEPYLPRVEEVCIARCHPHDGWFRAVVVNQENGAGSPKLLLLYLDYGNTATVSMADVRRMPPEFAEVPALACHVEVKGLSSPLSAAALRKAKEFMGIAEDAAAGRLPVTACERQDHGIYEVTAPELIAAVKNL